MQHFVQEKKLAQMVLFGYYDKESNINFVYPDLLYKAIKDYYNKQGIAFPWNKSTMCKELFLGGYLYQTEKQDRPQIRRKNPKTGKEETFIGLKQEKLHITYRYLQNRKITTEDNVNM